MIVKIANSIIISPVRCPKDVGVSPKNRWGKSKISLQIVMPVNNNSIVNCEITTIRNVLLLKLNITLHLYSWPNVVNQPREVRTSAEFALCTPGMGANLWGVSPLYMNPVSVSIHTDTSTSQRQGHRREAVSVGSPSAEL
jgi:hypothetical protein